MRSISNEADHRKKYPIKQFGRGFDLEILTTPLQGLYVAVSSGSSDQRGAFSRLYCEQELNEVLNGRRIVQINHSMTLSVGCVRGMHFQKPPYAEMKLVRCLRGRVLDVAVDLRSGSSSFLKWHAEELSPDSKRMLIIPEGFAHGFQVLERGSELLYLHTTAYAPQAEGGVSYADPRLDIRWPLPAVDVSDRDATHLPLSSDFKGIVL